MVVMDPHWQSREMHDSTLLSGASPDSREMASIWTKQNVSPTLGPVLIISLFILIMHTLGIRKESTQFANHPLLYVPCTLSLVSQMNSAMNGSNNHRSTPF